MDHTICPVCNGLTSLLAYCPECNNILVDQGKYTDYLDNYSPYRMIDDLKMTDGFHDYENHTCPHTVSCPECKFTDVKLVSET